MKKEYKDIYINAELIHVYSSLKNVDIEGNVHELTLKDMKENIGRDFVIEFNNASFNLKFFSAIVFNQIGEKQL